MSAHERRSFVPASSVHGTRPGPLRTALDWRDLSLGAGRFAQLMGARAGVQLVLGRPSWRSSPAGFRWRLRLRGRQGMGERATSPGRVACPVHSRCHRISSRQKPGRTQHGLVVELKEIGRFAGAILVIATNVSPRSQVSTRSALWITPNHETSGLRRWVPLARLPSPAPTPFLVTIDGTRFQAQGQNLACVPTPKSLARRPRPVGLSRETTRRLTEHRAEVAKARHRGPMCVHSVHPYRQGAAQGPADSGVQQGLAECHATAGYAGILLPDLRRSGVRAMVRAGIPEESGFE